MSQTSLTAFFAHTFSVIAVPGYFTPPVSDWGMRNELEKAANSVDSVSRLHMYIHQPTYSSSDDFTWEAFLKTGYDLAEDLARLANEVRPKKTIQSQLLIPSKFPYRPIIFIAHSLGGALLKKAYLQCGMLVVRLTINRHYFWRIRIFKICGSNWS